MNYDVYKLTVNLDATLAVQNKNGSFNYFKPSIGVEITMDEVDDLKILSSKFEDLYAEVIGPNFNTVVKEFLLNSKEDEPEEKEVNSGCGCENESCGCKPLEIGEKTVHYDSETLLPVNAEDLPKEEWE